MQKSDGSTNLVSYFFRRIETSSTRDVILVKDTGTFSKFGVIALFNSLRMCGNVDLNLTWTYISVMVRLIHRNLYTKLIF